MKINPISQSVTHNPVPAKSAPSPAGTQSPALASDNAHIEAVHSGSISSQLSFSSEIQTLSASQLSQDLTQIYEYLNAFGTPTMSNLQAHEDGTVSYTVTLNNDEYATETGEVSQISFDFTGEIQDGQIVKRRPASKNYAAQQVGEISDGLNVYNLRHGKHEGFERIVFDLGAGGGYSGIELQKNIDTKGLQSAFQARDENGDYAIFLEISGVRFSELDWNKLPQDLHNVKGIEPWPLYDDSSIGFKIVLKAEAEFTLDPKYPGRAVIDIQDPQ